MLSGYARKAGRLIWLCSLVMPAMMLAVMAKLPKHAGYNGYACFAAWLCWKCWPDMLVGYIVFLCWLDILAKYAVVKLSGNPGYVCLLAVPAMLAAYAV
jgi:hypothetical protein